MPLDPSLTTELGRAAAPGSATSADPGEETAELVWPANLAVLDRMARSDAVIRGSLRAVTGPMLAADWKLDGTGCDPRVVQYVEQELGLTTDGGGRYRSRPGGVEWQPTLRHALHSLKFGHYPMELVLDVGPSDVEGITGTVVHLAKLAPRSPRTLDSVDVAPDGGLQGIRQRLPEKRAQGLERSVFIPVEKLAYFVHEREGGGWYGESVLRAAYKHWLIREGMLRTSAVAVDRTGVGVPVVQYDPEAKGIGDVNAIRDQALAIARAIRAGDDAGLAVPLGMVPKLMGVEGTVVDPLPWVRYHEQAMAHATLTMGLHLGHDAGARSLGETMLDVMVDAQNETTREVASVFTDYVIRKLVRWTFGDSEPWPVLTPSKITRSDDALLTTLAGLASAGLLGTIDEPLVRAIRSRTSLPQPVTGEGPAGPPEGDPADDGVRGPTQTGPAGGPVPSGAGAFPGAPVIAPVGAVPPTSTRSGPSASPGANGPTVRAAEQPAAYVAETEAIRERRKTPEARAAHAFRPAKWTHPNGHPRCALCGDEESTSGRCPGSDRDDLSAAPVTPGATGDLVATLARVTELVSAVALAEGRTP